MDSGLVHNLNPVIARLAGIELYYYGLAYAVGFAGIHFWLRLRRNSMGWELSDVYDFSILFSLCVLLIGRLFAVFVYHWEYYQDHLGELFYYWRGGMATHGVLLGAVLSMFLYARWRHVSFCRLADEIAIPAAFLLALGRIGNFINGQICGTVTSLWWGVKFPQIDGFRHPVTLYEALKNMMIIPILLIVSRKQKAGRGQIAAHFILWYGFLRIFTDIFRDHGAQFLGIGRNQYFNAIMAVAGLILIIVYSRLDESQRYRPSTIMSQTYEKSSMARRNPNMAIGMWFRRSIFVLVILFSLVIRSAWTPEVLEERRANRVTHCIEIDSSEIGEHKIQ